MSTPGNRARSSSGTTAACCTPAAATTPTAIAATCARPASAEPARRWRRLVEGIVPVSQLDKLTPAQLLAMHADIAEELRRRGILRSANNPTADLAELLFCRA